jgi:hypothetical protein
MNSITQQLGFNTMNDDDAWVVEIHDEIEALPFGHAEVLSPDMVGQLDAEEGRPFAPEVYFIRHRDKCLYAAGFASVRGHSYLTDPFLNRDDDAIEDDYTWIAQGGN